MNIISILRLKTLIVSFFPILYLIIYSAKLNSDFNLLTSLILLISACSVQALSNVINTFYDIKKGNKQSSFKKIPEYNLSFIKKVIFSLLTIIIFSGLYLVIKGNLIILLIGLVSILFAYLYTGSKLSLSYLGISEFFVFLFFGPVLFYGSSIILNIPFNLALLFDSLSFGIIPISILTLNNLRDFNEDRLACKKTAVVRFGLRFGKIEYLIATILPFIFNLEMNYLIFIYLFFVLFLNYKVLKATEPKVFHSLFKLNFLLMICFYLVKFLTI